MSDFSDREWELISRIQELEEALRYLSEWDPIKATVLGSDDWRIIAKHVLDGEGT